MEGLFEKELKGQNGCAISIVDSNGNKKKIVVSTIVENGKDIKLTIDSDLQKELYEQYKDAKTISLIGKFNINVFNNVESINIIIEEIK